MKTIILTTILVLVAGQASAEGFYQSIVGNSPQSEYEVNSDATEFTYTPLYNRVSGNPQHAVDHKQQTEQKAGSSVLRDRELHFDSPSELTWDARVT